MLLLAGTEAWGADAAVAVAGRLRAERVDDARLDPVARATTLRLHPSARTADWRGLHAEGSLDLTRHLGPERFDDGIHGRTAYPVVADPDAEELDELFVEAAGGGPTRSLQGWAGRRDWTVANARFFGGGLAWRQNAQSFDGAGLSLRRGTVALELTGLGRVNRVPGNRSSKGIQPLAGRVAELRWVPGGPVRGALLAADLAYPDGPALPASASNRMLDATLEWAPDAAAGWAPSLRGELGTQRARRAEGSAAGVYRALQLCLAHGGARTCAMREELRGDGHRALQTPLAGLHAFNGTADRFVTTPADGLDDRALSVGLRVQGIQLEAAGHQFRTTAGGLYGAELDLSASWRPVPSHTLLIKWARYEDHTDAELALRAPVQAADVSKCWLQWEFSWRS